MSERQARYGGGAGGDAWDAERVRALRQQLGFSQSRFADELGVRQQTVSEWETGRYAPRGASARLLRVVAERAEQGYRATSDDHSRRPDAPYAASERAVKGGELSGEGDSSGRSGTERVS